MGTSILLSGKKTDLSFELTPPLPGKHEMALQSLSMYYSWPNITDNNNELVYHVIDGDITKTIIFPKGTYDLGSLSTFIRLKLKEHGDEDAFQLGANENTLKVVFDIMDGYAVKIGDSSIKTVLGWKSGVLNKGVHTSTEKVNITDILEILVHCNVINGIYTPHADNSTKLSKQTVLASFSPNVAPGYKIIIEPNKLFYSPINTDVLKEIRVWLTDQDYNPIDNLSEILTVKIHIRPLSN